MRRWLTPIYLLLVFAIAAVASVALEPSLAERIADNAPCDTEVLTTAGDADALGQVEENIDSWSKREGILVETARSMDGGFLAVVMVKCGADRMEIAK